MANTPLWVFGYGSLMWEPGFDYVEKHVVRLWGYHRSFCMWSYHYRGTREAPGLVLALDEHEDAFCDGVAYCIAPEKAGDTLAYLRERELISHAYVEAIVPLTLPDGKEIEAVTYVINKSHEQYCRETRLEKQAAIIAGARGGRGPNATYLANTVRHLQDLGLQDRDLDWLANRVNEIAGRSDENRSRR